MTYKEIEQAYGLTDGYILKWSQLLKTTPQVIIDDIVEEGDFEHSSKTSYEYQTHETKKQLSLANQHLFLKIKLPTFTS